NHQMRAMYRVPLFDLHDVHGGVRVGKLTTARADPKHLFVEGHVNDSPEGDDYLDNVREGKRPHFSIAFDNPQSRRRGHITRRMKADLMHVAGVPEGAFGNAAALAGVRALTMDGAGAGIVPPADADAHHVMALQDLLARCTPDECMELAGMAEAMHAESHPVRSRFSELEGALAAKGAADPGALAHYIGVHKYGKEGFKALQAAGRAKHHAENDGGEAGSRAADPTLPPNMLEAARLIASLPVLPV
ncbi:MAG TPA: hypothetical protein VHV49_04805, partial [Pseudonocardiaceae bacterium]|nr:hypothetical protein [Pseudonocardiaceae bacterium]